MPDFGALTMVGAIATVLCIGLSIAAFLNARRQAPKQKAPAPADAPWGLPFLEKKEAVAKNISETSDNGADSERRSVFREIEPRNPAFKPDSPSARFAAGGKSESEEYLWE